MIIYDTDRLALKRRMLAAKGSEAYRELFRLRELVRLSLGCDDLLLAAHRRGDAGAFYLLSRGSKKTTDNLARSCAEQVFCGLLLDGEDAAADRYVELSNAAINAEVARTYSKPGVVYFLHDPQNRLIKIGYTVDLRNRMSALQTNSGDPRVLLKTIIGTPELEAALHARFSRHRVRPNSEWFRDASEIREFIAEQAAS
jgi:hypothetical protein